MTTATALGVEVPRIFTPPLRELTPDTSLGFRCIAFGEEILGFRFDPWQRWWLIHALELNPDGSFRFRTLLLLIARQNGKTEVVKALCLWLMFTGRAHLVVGSAQNLGIARLAWESACKLARAVPAELEVQVAKVRVDNNDPHLLLTNGAKYMIAASTEDAGRGIPGVDVLVLDELRTHRDSRAWAALTATTTAKPNALVVAMSNAGSDDSQVLNALQEAGREGADPTLFLAEYSAPDGCPLDDRAAWAMANPSLGHGRLTARALESALSLDPAAVFRTERLCQRVENLDSALDLPSWRECLDRAGVIGRGDAESDEAWAARRAAMRIVACLDVSPDGTHATLVLACATGDGRVRLEVAAAWRDTGAARDALPGLLAAIRPDVLAWYPTGPAAALATLLADRRTLPSRRTKVEALKGERVTAACMGLADLVRGRRVLHPGDALLDAQVLSAGKAHSAGGWRFTRSGSANVDAVYAAAGAAYLALMLAPRGAAWEGVVI